MGALTHLSRSKILPSKLLNPSQDKELLDQLDYAHDIYCLLKFVRENHPRVHACLHGQNVERTMGRRGFGKKICMCGFLALANELGQVDWALVNDMELFLEPFYETTQIFNNAKQPHFHRVSERKMGLGTLRGFMGFKIFERFEGFYGVLRFMKGFGIFLRAFVRLEGFEDFLWLGRF